MRKGFIAIIATVATVILCVNTPVQAGSESILGKLKGFFAATSSPREVLTSYLDAKRRGDFAAAHALLSSEDQLARPKDKFISSEGEGYAIFAAFTALIEQSVSEVTSGDKRVTATVETKHPDPKAMLGALLGVAMTGDKKSIDNATAEKLASGDLPMTTTTSKMTLIKEGNEWRVYEGYKLKDRVARLTADAQRFEKENRFDAAIETYDDLLSLKADIDTDSDLHKQRDSIVTKREEAGHKLAQAKDNAAYISNISLYDFKAGYHDSILEKRVPGVTFKLKNNGDKTLKRVEVTVYFKDAKGGVISEETYVPVSTGAIFGDRKPLRPGYIWQMEQGTFYAAKSVPSEWKESSALAKVTSIEIAD